MKPAVRNGLIVAVVVLIAAGAGVFWFLRDDSPDEVSTDAVASSIAENSSTTTSPEGQTTSDDVSGNWTVDAATGEFDYETATGTFAGIRIEEELASIGSTTAVGRTGDVAGTVEIDGTDVTAAEIEVDLSTITTNESRRDDKVQEALETGQFPTATFALTAPIELGDGATSGESVLVDAVGDLTIHGQTQSVTIPLDARLVNGTIVITGQVDIVFSDFGVSVPESPVVLSVADIGTLELQLLLTRG